VRVDELGNNFDLQIRWTAFPLRPDTPEEGLSLEKVYADRGIDLTQATARLRRVADELGLPLGERTRTYNSRLAQELAKWAELKGRDAAYHKAVFRAYFVEGRNIGKADELLALVASLGLPREEAVSVLRERTFKRAVDSDWNRCHEMGVTAVPTFVMNQQAVVGAQPYDVLERFLFAQGMKKKR
jgi:predicted DsbA family dithiol-disulfide isomerase